MIRFLLPRCQHCARFVWPWQRRGWFVARDGWIYVWHPACDELYLARAREAANTLLT